MLQSGSLHAAAAALDAFAEVSAAVVVAVPGACPVIIGTIPAFGPVATRFVARERANCWCRFTTWICMPGTAMEEEVIAARVAAAADRLCAAGPRVRAGPANATAATVAMAAPVVSTARIFTNVSPRSSSVTGSPPSRSADFHMCDYLVLSLDYLEWNRLRRGSGPAIGISAG